MGGDHGPTGGASGAAQGDRAAAGCALPDLRPRGRGRSRCWPASRRSPRRRPSCIAKSPCAWTTSRARRCAAAAGNRRCGRRWRRSRLGDADFCVSAGNTGALMAMSKFCLRTMASIERPAIAAIWPTLRGESVVLDVGATIGADAHQLIDFAILGAAMARALFDIERPTRRPAQCRRRGDQGPGRGQGGRPRAARGGPDARWTIAASSRATTSARAPSTSWSPRALPATSR